MLLGSTNAPIIRMRSARVPIFWMASFIAPLLLMCLQAWLCDIYPFGSQSFLTGDFRFQYIDFFSWYREILLGNGNFSTLLLKRSVRTCGGCLAIILPVHSIYLFCCSMRAILLISVFG